MTPSGVDLYGFQPFARVSGVGGVPHAHRNGIRKSVAGVVAELAILVDSPGVDVVVVAHGQRIIGSAADLHEGEIRRRVCGVAHPDGRIPVGCRPVAELTILVESPGVGVPVAAYGQRIIASAADLHVGEIRWKIRICFAVRRLHSDRLSLIAAGCSVAELAIPVVSPSVDVAVVADGQRMPVSGADLHEGEIRRRAYRFAHPDRRSPSGDRPVAELAILVTSPGVSVPVAGHSQGKTVIVVCSSADLAEPDASAGVWRGDGRGLVAQLAALVGADAPRAVPACGRPLGGQGQVLVDGPAEVVGDFAGEPSVEQEAFARRVGGRPLHPAVSGGEMLVCWFRASSVRVESDRERGSWLNALRQRLVDRVVEAHAERLAVLPPDECDGG